MAINLHSKTGTGMTMQQFMETMEKNKEEFYGWYERFSWETEKEHSQIAATVQQAGLRAFLLCAEWCGDVVRNVPVLFRVAEAVSLPVEVLVMEDHLDVMDQFLTMGGRAIPVLIICNKDSDVLATWGPRPAHVQKIMTEFKQENPDREAHDYQDKIMVARQEMLAQYGEGTGYQQVIVQELSDLFRQIQ
ncbi:thioredoxin family protein [Brevibacillus halotolerans]|uniref:thioredoxin family protein n=1 Tax=Brevibacillus TaxID=55080 RepID=UPI00215D0050|nr:MULTISPECIES: thioredoxin family protein [Brevibacillus]MCR8962786.1 thioredoxin family protein [Brevibacillus laterosporus]MCZ0834941.1 thioredoxin family protein [Brevibacillus halotolerans]